MDCKCEVCQDKDINQEGIKILEEEILPFFKKDLLALKHLDHPLPMKYKGLLASCSAFSQALAFNRAHNIEGIYYTENEWMLKFSVQLQKKFKMPTLHVRYLPKQHGEVCEFNAKLN